MILSFRDPETAAIWRGVFSTRLPPDIQRAARRRLLMLNAATRLLDLAVLPGNRLHALVGDRKGQFSLAVNSQWRICFQWKEGNAYEVEITDYHG
jgi:proteic killer suppression protein